MNTRFGPWPLRCKSSKGYSTKDPELPNRQFRVLLFVRVAGNGVIRQWRRYTRKGLIPDMERVEAAMRKNLLKALHRIFDPTVVGAEAKMFSLKYPRHGSGIPVSEKYPTRAPVPGNSSLERVKVRTDIAVGTIDQTLEMLSSDMTGDVELTLGRLREALHADRNPEVNIRRLDLPFTTPIKAYLVYMVSVVDANEVDRALLGPLMQFPRYESRQTGVELLQLVDRSLLPGRQTVPAFSLSKVADAVAAGQCALLLDTVPGVLLTDLRKFPGRGVEQPTTEQVVRGAQESFTESLLTNVGLVRRRLQTPDLIFEMLEIGRRSRTHVAIAYLDGVVNPVLLAEVHKRLNGLDIDALTSSGALEQMIEDSPYGIMPTLQDTQRPDRAAAAITEGRVVLMVDGTPFVLIAPVVFADFYHNPEDYDIKWPFGIILRFIRLSGLLVTLLLPGMYIAIANYHQEMIPASLLLAIAASREAVPFPAPVEVVMMEVAFEIIREGSLRIPTVLGQTVGIVGALILGQAAVQATIVSPILVIVVATTALGSFTIPNYSMSLPIRFGRFIFIALAASFGLYGVAAGLFLWSAHAASLRSFGVPYMAPGGPRIKGSPDVLMRGPMFAMERRPDLARPLDKQRQADNLMTWNPTVEQPRSDGKEGGSSSGTAVD